MANFPTSLPSITNPGANDTLAAISHHTQHGTANDEIAAIATKIGTGSSTPTANKLLVGSGSGASAWSDTGIYIGSGESQDYTATEVAPVRLGVRKGTAASPDGSVGPLVKIERLSQVTDTDITVGGDGSEQLAALLVTVKGTASSQNQPIAVLGQVIHEGTASAASGRYPDATGGYFSGTIEGAGIGTGIGIFTAGITRSASPLSNVTGLEVAVYNISGNDHSAVHTGPSKSKGIWMNAGAGDRCAVGIQFGQSFGTQFDYGIVFNSNTVSGKTGPVKTASIADYSSSETSIIVNGSHDFGIVTYGGTFATAAMWLGNGETNGIAATNNASTAADNILHYNTSDAVVIGRDADGITLAQSVYIGTKDIVTDTTTGTKIGTGSTQKLGFYGATPVVRPSGVAVSAAGIHAALVTLGLIAA